MDIKDILEYGYYDENKNYIVVLDTSKLKQLFKADEIKLAPEKEHK